MPKFTIEFEADSLEDVTHQLFALFSDRQLKPVAAPAASFPDDEQPETEAEAAPVPNGDAGKRGRGRPKKTTVTPVSAQETREQNLAANSQAAEPETPAETPKAKPSATAQQLAASVASSQATDLPALDVLKQAVTTAVRQAQKGEGDPAILALLPNFKTETGLPFVMNAQEEHRPALFNLIKQAGLTLG